jgi:hypothetical protein
MKDWENCVKVMKMVAEEVVGLEERRRLKGRYGEQYAEIREEKCNLPQDIGSALQKSKF